MTWGEEKKGHDTREERWKGGGGREKKGRKGREESLFCTLTLCSGCPLTHSVCGWVNTHMLPKWSTLLCFHTFLSRCFIFHSLHISLFFFSFILAKSFKLWPSAVFTCCQWVDKHVSVSFLHFGIILTPAYVFHDLISFKWRGSIYLIWSSRTLKNKFPSRWIEL